MPKPDTTPQFSWSAILAAAFFLAVAAVVLTGCETKLDPQEYGEIVYELPKVKGADVPYPLPKLEESEDGPQPDRK